MFFLRHCDRGAYGGRCKDAHKGDNEKDGKEKKTYKLKLGTNEEVKKVWCTFKFSRLENSSPKYLARKGKTLKNSLKSKENSKISVR